MIYSFVLHGTSRGVIIKLSSVVVSDSECTAAVVPESRYSVVSVNTCSVVGTAEGTKSAGPEDTVRALVMIYCAVLHKKTNKL